jgi:hypothetical protein
MHKLSRRDVAQTERGLVQASFTNNEASHSKQALPKARTRRTSYKPCILCAYWSCSSETHCCCCCCYCCCCYCCYCCCSSSLAVDDVRNVLNAQPSHRALLVCKVHVHSAQVYQTATAAAALRQATLFSRYMHRSFAIWYTMRSCKPQTANATPYITTAHAPPDTPTCDTCSLYTARNTTFKPLYITGCINACAHDCLNLLAKTVASKHV